MPYAYRVTRVTISGTMFGGAEEWSTGFFMGATDADADLPTQGLADDIKGAWTIFHKNGNNTISNQCRATLVKVSSVGTDGKSNEGDTKFSTFGTDVVGPAPFSAPPQISLAVSLRSADARGLGSRGRMYLPMITAGLDGTGHINTTDQNNIKNALLTFFNAVNATSMTPNLIINASQGQLTGTKPRVPKPGGLPPKNSVVQRFELGNVLDTQRRRRNALVETYVSQAITIIQP